MRKTSAVILSLIVVLYHSAVSSGESSAGQRFIIGFPRNNGEGDGPQELSISIANYESNNIDFLVTAEGFSSTGTLTPLTATNVTVPLDLQGLFINERNKGILVKATGDVYVHGLSYSSGTTDSYLALPCLTLPVNEYEYFAISYEVIPGISTRPATILLVACDDDTAITIGSTSMTLNSMETYLMLNTAADLTGTRITSSKPVSVFSGVDCTNVPINIGYCDHLVEQVPPTVTWGSRFFVSSLNGRNSSQLIRVLSARTANVTVTCNTAVSVSQFQLTSGNHESFEIPVDSYCSIESIGPVLVAQYAYGNMADNIGDPFMMIIPPTEQYINRHIFEIDASLNLSSYFTVYVASEFFDNSEILLNDNAIPNWQPVPCYNDPVCGYIAKMSVDPGVYRIQHQNSSAFIGVSVYGFNVFTSYGMPVGMGLSPIQCNTTENFTCTCTEGFSANGTFCIAITCPPLTSPTNGSVTYASTPDGNGYYSFNSMASYNCNIGFALVGDASRAYIGDGSSTTDVFTLICTGDDGFTEDSCNEVPTCQEITCPFLPDLVNGSLTYSDDRNQNNSYAFNVVVTYSCDTGFSLVGNSNRTCTGDGSSVIGAFSGIYPTCEVITCSSLNNPMNGLVMYTGVVNTGNGNWEFGTEANYICNTGFSLVGNSNRTCTGDGSSVIGAFSGMNPTCEAIFCPSLTSPVNGSVTYTSTANGNGSYPFNSVATYSCDTRFSLVGNIAKTCTGNGSSTTGAFSGMTPICQAITCHSLSNLGNGSLIYSRAHDRNGNYAFNTVATYSCDSGFIFMGHAVRMCTGDGSSVTGAFTVVESSGSNNGSGSGVRSTSPRVNPSCEAITCPFLPDLVNGSLTYSDDPNQNNSYAFNVVVTYSCNTEFSLVGNSNRTCTGDGSSVIGAFSGMDPTCEAIICSSLTDPTNGTISYSDLIGGNGSYAFNVIANHTCDEGFVLVGNNTRTCTGDGSSVTGAFDGVAPSCETIFSSSSGIITIVVPIVGVVGGVSLVLLVGAVYGYIRVVVQLFKKIRKQDPGSLKLIT